MKLSPIQLKALHEKHKRKNAPLHDLLADKTPKLEPDSSNESLAKKRTKKTYNGYSFPVDIEFHSRRKRLLDIDNFCVKYVIDALRYCGVLSEDNPEFVEKVITSQEKTKKGEEEMVEIRIYKS